MPSPNKAKIQGQDPDDPADQTPGSLGINDKAERNATKPSTYGDLFPTGEEAMAIMDREALQRSIRRKAIDTLVEEGMPEFKAVSRVDRALQIIQHTANPSGNAPQTQGQAQAVADAKAQALKDLGTDQAKAVAAGIASSPPAQMLKGAGTAIAGTAPAQALAAGTGQVVDSINTGTAELADWAADKVVMIAKWLNINWQPGPKTGADPKFDNSDAGIFATKEDGAYLLGIYYTPSTGT